MTMNDPLILVINCGSSSLKFAVFTGADRQPMLSGLAENLGKNDAAITFKDAEKVTVSLNGESHSGALDVLLHHLAERGWLDQVVAVGHRVVHGAERFKASTVIDDAVLADIDACRHLAPLHNFANLLGIRAVMAKLPNVPNVAVCDTAFHQTIPPEAYYYALPRSLYREHGVRRYGFHGTSFRYVTEEAIAMLGLDPANHGMIIAHLGNGSSVCAVQNGKSVDTSMGMTPLEGLVMGTRSGDVDPGIFGFMGEQMYLDVHGIMSLLNTRSGLLGLSELSNDVRTLTAAANDGHDGAKLALDVFVHRLAHYIGALAMSLKRLDAIVFTGGIGENSAPVRAAAMARLGVLGVKIDEAANQATVLGKQGRVSRSDRPLVAVVTTNEEWMIAREAADVVRAQGVVA